MHWWMNARDPMSAWTHFAWMILAIPGTLLLLWLSRQRPVRQASMLVFSLSLIFSMLGSFLYHAVPLGDSAPFEALDHVGIYVLIAGTVTAIAVIGLRGWWRVGLLIGIWVLAAVGIAVRLLDHSPEGPPLAVRTGFYLLMGWIGVVAYFQLARRLSHYKVSLIWIGGLIYSTGALINVCHWPNIASWLDAHDLFHLFVMGGSLAHYTFLVVVLMPHREPAQAIPSYLDLEAPVGATAQPQTTT
jgi:hemolysin III